MLAFESRRTAQNEIYRVAVDGGAPQRLTSAGGSEPDWSPDGGRIAFATPSGIAVMNMDGSNSMTLTSGVDRTPRWRPDHGAIAFARRITFSNLEIFTVAPDGSSPTNLTASAATIDIDPRWSRDAQRLAMQGGSGTNTEIQVVDADGSNLRNLTRSAANDASPRWGPDGRALSFTSGNEIYVLSSLDAMAENVTNDSSTDSSADWRPPP
jgi:Tol biopolymer transport system component